MKPLQWILAFVRSREWTPSDAVATACALLAAGMSFFFQDGDVPVVPIASIDVVQSEDTQVSAHAIEDNLTNELLAAAEARVCRLESQFDVRMTRAMEQAHSNAQEWERDLLENLRSVQRERIATRKSIGAQSEAQEEASWLARMKRRVRAAVELELVEQVQLARSELEEELQCARQGFLAAELFRR